MEDNHTSQAWLEVMLKKHIRDNSVAKVVSIDVEPAVGKGENYASVVERARITVIMGSGRTTHKSVIIKRLPDRELFSKFLEEYSLFKTETKVYADILSEMEYLMLEHADQDDILWPDFVGHKAYETIIFNDLKEMNYTSVDRMDMLDKTHGYLAIRSLARYHAMTVVMFKKGVINTNEFEPIFFARNSKTVNRMVQGGMKLCAQVMKDSWGPEWEEAAMRIDKAAETCCDRLEELSQIDSTKLNVLNHGDFWTSNMMFKYSPCSGHDYPIGIRFVDFQMSHWNSYGFDLVYFIYTSLKPALRRSQYDKLLEAYHESLLATFKFYNYKSARIPSLEDVKKELERLSFFSLMSFIVNLAVTSSQCEDALDIEKCMIDDEAISVHSPAIYASESFKSATQKEIREWLNKGVF